MATHARRDQFAHRVGAHGAHGVHLLGDQHRAEFRGHARSIAPGDESPVIVGPNSRTSASATTSPVSEVSPKRTNCDAVCNTMTAPIKKPVSSTMGSEPTPMMSICSSRSLT